MTGTRSVTINGCARQVAADGATLLLDVLRADLGLMAARFGCGAESCGACMVLVDGRPSYACTLTLDALGAGAVTTLEGLGTAAAPHPLQQAFIDEQAGQCGYCLSGILISAHALLADNARPSRAEIAAALDRHLCRCGAHARILRAVARAARALATPEPRP